MVNRTSLPSGGDVAARGAIFARVLPENAFKFLKTSYPVTTPCGIVGA